MSTRSVTILMQDGLDWYYEEEDCQEVMRFYRHFDGYPTGHGYEMATALEQAAENELLDDTNGLAIFLGTLWNSIENEIEKLHVEIEPPGCVHGDLDYLYVVKGHYPDETSEKYYYTIECYHAYWNESYENIIGNEKCCVFSGSPRDFIKKLQTGVIRD